MMIVFRVRRVLGEHVHCAFFSAPAPGMTFAKCGDLIFREAEFDEFRRRLGADGQFIEELERSPGAGR